MIPLSRNINDKGIKKKTVVALRFLFTCINHKLDTSSSTGQGEFATRLGIKSMLVTDFRGPYVSKAHVRIFFTETYTVFCLRMLCAGVVKRREQK